jgi:hypothetical protein
MDNPTKPNELANNNAGELTAEDLDKVTGGGATLALNQLAPIEMPLATEITLAPTTATTTSSTGSNTKGYDLTTNKPA